MMLPAPCDSRVLITTYEVLTHYALPFGPLRDVRMQRAATDLALRPSITGESDGQRSEAEQPGGEEAQATEGEGHRRCVSLYRHKGAGSTPACSERIEAPGIGASLLVPLPRSNVLPALVIRLNAFA